MNEQPRDPLLLDHDADGIQELDNNLPRWWVWLFHLSIAFSVFYMVYYHVLKAGDLQIAAYEKELAAGERIKSEAIGRFEANLVSLLPSQDLDVLARGRESYASLCAPCHRDDGGGLVGPNLCDDYWIHGSSYLDSLKIIINGVPEKGMLTWRGVLKPGEIQAVASYIYTFRGTSPPNPKPREDQAGPAQPNIYE
ncbi:MAG TPA: cbb3-type cytochrome c oxidase N-terminal domain-containing protein [Methylomirabilota bacterium]|nr:cbb3-type cytochrome c oxidase N-terminal domain-containing protein [Methylomirabilota bacterium]